MSTRPPGSALPEDGAKRVAMAWAGYLAATLAALAAATFSLVTVMALTA